MAEQPCPKRFRLPDGFIDILKTRVENPKGRWKDFNPDWDSWTYLNHIRLAKMMCEQDLPNEPELDDYEDFDSDRTREGKGSIPAGPEEF